MRNNTDEIKNIEEELMELISELENIKKICNNKDEKNSLIEQDIRFAFFSIAEEISNLKVENEKVRKANSLIEEISGKTKMLSFNASIEAAHSGDNGKTFTIIAEQIKKLADESKDSSKIVEEMISKINDIETNFDSQMNNLNKILSNLSGKEEDPDNKYKITKKMNQIILKLNENKEKISKLSQ